MEKKFDPTDVASLVIASLITSGLIPNAYYTIDDAPVTEPPVTEPKGHSIEFFIHRIADKKGWKYEKTAGWLESIAEVSPVAAFGIVAREIAVFLDQKYEDHIEDSEKIYCISTLDGRIHEVCKKYIKNYRNFAAFRTIEDAKYCCNMLREQLKAMFSGHAKE